MLVTLPFLLLLLDYWPLGRGLGAGNWGLGIGESNPGSLVEDPNTLPAQSEICDLESESCNSRSSVHRQPSTSVLRLVVEKIPLFILAASSCVVTLAAQGAAIQPLKQLDLSSRAANAAVAYTSYLAQLFNPANLAVLYPLPSRPPPAWNVIAIIAVLLAISVLVFLMRRKCPYLLVGWLWYLGTLVPVIGLVQVGGQATADRYTYLTQIGLYAALPGGWRRLPRWRYRRWPLAAGSALVLAALMACAWQQTWQWRGQ